jgi:acyl-CoA reductase-like NAD-dependent aldehyde dehydrogenase
MYERESFLIGGRWEAAGEEWADVVSPSTEESIGRVRRATSADVDAAVAAARQAFDEGPWPRMSVEERAAIVLDALARLEPQVEEIGRLMSSEMGAPFAGVVARHLPGALAMGRSLVEHARTIVTRSVRPGRLGWALVEREPLGVVAAIIPWNSPFSLALTKALSPLMAGCSVILKPAEETPLDAYVIGEALYAAGLPEGVLSIVPADRLVGEHLVRHAGVDMVSFTGSTVGGRQVGAICGQQFKRALLELGGKSAAIVLDDADLDAIVPSLQAGAFTNSGQVCAALTRVLASGSHYEEIVSRLADAARSTRVGDPFDARTQMGPLVSARQRERVERYIETGVREGAKLAAGGGRPIGLERGYYIEPTVFADVSNSMTIAQEEIFGPVVVLIPYEDEDHAIALANDSPYGLHGGVFTGDPEHGVEVARRVVTGTVSVNSFTINSDAPFGGRKCSGLGREFGPEGIGSYLEFKTINVPASVAEARP